MKSLLLTSVIAFFFTGCAADYTCGMFPSSGCQPISKVDENTKGELYDYRDDLYMQSQANKKKKRSSSAKQKIGKSTVLRTVEPGNPIIAKPEILKIYFADWIDEDRDYNAGGYMFIRVRDADWTQN